MRCVEDLDQCDTSLLHRVPDKTIPRYLYVDGRLDASEALERIHDARITTLIELGFEIRPVRYPRDANTIIIYGTEDYLRASMENVSDDEALARLNQHYSKSNDDAANEFCYVTAFSNSPERSVLYVSNDLGSPCLETALMSTIGLRPIIGYLPSISNIDMSYDYVTFGDRVLAAILYRDDFVKTFTNGDRRMILEKAVREEYLNTLERQPSE
ncbi:MAG: hypothetical protein AAGJ34_05045 [Pseudomonadota bacterium]